MAAMKVAIVYDRVNKWGGAERLLLVLNEMFPKASLYTSVYSSKKAPWAKKFPRVVPSFLNKLSFFRDKHELLGALTPIAFESFDFSGFDLVISVASEAAKGIITKHPTKHICICLTPTRYLWSGHDEYFKNPLLRFFSRTAVRDLKKWDKKAAQRPDRIIAISTAVQERIRKYYGRKSVVIHPPVDLKGVRAPRVKKGDYYLLVSRLVPYYKKVDLVINVFNEMGKKLIVVGTGNMLRSLRRTAKKNIRFVGEVTDRKLIGYYKGARALVHPQEEDFGLVAVEAQSFGVPVIAYKKGGALDTVNEKTGMFFEKQQKDNMIKAVQKFEGRKFNKSQIKKNASKFSKKNFKEKLKKEIRLL